MFYVNNYKILTQFYFNPSVNYIDLIFIAIPVSYPKMNDDVLNVHSLTITSADSL